MQAQGYCHFNDNEENTGFSINLFGQDLVIEQDPGSRDLGHGAVVWDASVVLVKYMEKNYKEYDVQKLSGKTVLELGSGCGLGGIAFMMKGAKVSCTDLEIVTKRLTEKNVEAVYLKLKGSMDTTTSSQTQKPLVYPIDWTQNPICQNLLKCSNKSGDVDNSATHQHSLLATVQATSVDAVAHCFDNICLGPDGKGQTEVANVDYNVQHSTNSFDLLVQGAPYDYVLLTDCVFAAELAVPLVNTILCCCGPRTTVICCHEIRDEVRKVI